MAGERTKSLQADEKSVDERQRAIADGQQRLRDAVARVMATADQAAG